MRLRSGVTLLLLYFACSSVALAQSYFLESGGKVVMETESMSAAGDWKKQTSISGYKGSGYLLWTGNNHFAVGSAGKGTIRYHFRISKAGNYQMNWRSRIAKGNNTTEHNDSWIRFPTGDNIRGEHGLRGWTKVYTNQGGRWSWASNTVDHVGNPIRQYFDAGNHYLEISGRSNGHAIDRI
ncbi:MAG: hypothetical protein KTR33_17245, partial [Gammaproteobacteria bacterium]|nr:hypothetical protein [Gammaproteobacteria bacterium]